MRVFLVLFLILFSSVSAYSKNICQEFLGNSPVKNYSSILMQDKEEMGGIENLFISPEKFFFEDLTYGFKFLATFDKKLGVVTLDESLENTEFNIKSLYDVDDLFDTMINHFGLKNVNAIVVEWTTDEQRAAFDYNIFLGLKIADAAKNTLIGVTSAHYGFNQAIIIDESGDIEIMTKTKVIFYRKNVETGILNKLLNL